MCLQTENSLGVSQAVRAAKGKKAKSSVEDKNWIEQGSRCLTDSWRKIEKYHRWQRKEASSQSAWALGGKISRLNRSRGDCFCTDTVS